MNTVPNFLAIVGMTPLDYSVSTCELLHRGQDLSKSLTPLPGPPVHKSGPTTLGLPVPSRKWVSLLQRRSESTPPRRGLPPCVPSCSGGQRSPLQENQIVPLPPNERGLPISSAPA